MYCITVTQILLHIHEYSIILDTVTVTWILDTVISRASIIVTHVHCYSIF